MRRVRVVLRRACVVHASCVRRACVVHASFCVVHASCMRRACVGRASCVASCGDIHMDATS